MPRVSEDVASQLEQLEERIAGLEARISALEQSEQPATLPVTPAALVANNASAPRGFLGVDLSSGVVPVLGKAVLGIAGAYLLRAVSESGAIAQFPMLIAAMVYAAAWMGWAVRTHRSNHLASVVYGITATLILCPLLWESTVRFQLLSSRATALVLVAFVVLALGLAWHHNLQALPWIATLASIVTAWALMIATHNLVPLTFALLAIALATEIAACLGHRLSLRFASGAAADSAIWLLVYVMASPDGVPESYQPVSSVVLVALCAALFFIYFASIGTRSFILRKRIANFEIAQGVIVLGLSFVGAFRVTRGAIGPALGVTLLLLSLTCYWGMLARFLGVDHERNRRISAVFACVLVVLGASLTFSAAIQVILLCGACLGTLFLFTHTRDVSLAAHSSFYLAAAVVVSPLPAFAQGALTGSTPGAPDWTVWAVVVAALLCYGFGSRTIEVPWSGRLLWLVPALVASLAIAAMTVVALYSLVTRRVQLNSSQVAGIRTVVTCLLALCLGFAASRWKRRELGWIAYTAVALGAVKLLFQDLRLGNARSLVVSLVFYGLILILLPRLMRRRVAL